MTWLLNKCLISFKDAFNQAFLASAGNLVTCAKFLGSIMKCDTYETDYPKVFNTSFSFFTTALKNLFKHFPILFAESSAPFRSFWICLIRPRTFNLESFVLNYGCIWLSSRMSSRTFVLTDLSSESSSIHESWIEAEIDSYSSELRSFSTKLPSSNVLKLSCCQFVHEMI